MVTSAIKKKKRQRKKERKWWAGHDLQEMRLEPHTSGVKIVLGREDCKSIKGGGRYGVSKNRRQE